MSRSAYREAIQVLTAKGPVESRTKAGTIVQPRSRWNLLDPDVLVWAFPGEPDLAFIQHLFELRSIVEPTAARLAATRRGRNDVTALTATPTAMRRHTLATDAGQAADRAFDDALLRATQNDALVTLSASIGAAVVWTTPCEQRAKALPRDPIPDHGRVVDAIAAEDPLAAEAAMRDLVDLAFNDTRASLAAAPPPPSPSPLR